MAPLELHHFEGADLTKKLDQLESFGRVVAAPELRKRVLLLAGGNPQLLERFNKVLADQQTDADAVLSAVEEVAEQFREETLLQVLITQQTAGFRHLLASLALVRLPMDLSSVKAINEGRYQDSHLQRAGALGLLERATPSLNSSNIEMGRSPASRGRGSKEL